MIFSFIEQLQDSQQQQTTEKFPVGTNLLASLRLLSFALMVQEPSQNQLNLFENTYALLTGVAENDSDYDEEFTSLFDSKKQSAKQLIDNTDLAPQFRTPH
jgi:hypothetical protein